MIKPKYPKRTDISQIARLTVECGTGCALAPEFRPNEMPKGGYENHPKKVKKKRSGRDH